MSEPTWEQLEAGRPPRQRTTAGPVNRVPVHGEVLGEIRRIRVAVRGQLDGIRPIEAVTLTYEWTPPVWGQDPVEIVAEGCWTFGGMETEVQGLDGALKPGTPLSAQDWALLGPALGWAWDLVHALRPRG